ncbi:MAG: SapC family protein [Rhizobacter sp.]
MIKSALYRDPQPLDAQRHRHKKLKPLEDYSIAKEMHAVFLAATEFPAAALSLPIIFVQSGEQLPDGRAVVVPVALMGISVSENLFVEGTRWDAGYVPAFIRRFPFLTAGATDSDTPAVFVDASWPGFHDTDGEPLFDAGGKPAPALQRALEFLRQFDFEQQRTRQFCQRLLELDVLKDMTMNATLPSGETLKLEGFFAVDEEKLNALPDPLVLELHRSGMLMLLQVHLVSLGNLKALLERKARRVAAAPVVA